MADLPLEDTRYFAAVGGGDHEAANASVGEMKALRGLGPSP